MSGAGGGAGPGRAPAAAKRRLPAAASSSSSPPPPPQLFEDTSSSPPGAAAATPAPLPAGRAPPQAPFLAEPVSSFAVAYGSSLATQGKQLVDRNIDRFIPVTKLKYYFAVDTLYVGRKLGLLLFPFLHQDWQVQYQQDTPVAPRFDINAPDLYIPVMAFITYILVAGLALGTQNRMIVGLVAGLLFGKTGYFLLLSWCCLSIFVFMIRTLRLKILSEAAAEGVLVRGAKNQLRMYLTMAVAGLQPVFMYWLTFHLVR